MFDGIIGHEHLKKLVLKELKDDKIPNGFLFSGPRGVGKHLFARELAAILNCTGNNKPCGECSNCRVMAENEHPDIIVIDPTANLKLDAKAKSSDGIKFRDVIDKVITDSVFRPSLGARKVVIIDDAADLSVPAMNNLLKILEEPPEYMVLILITSGVSRVLPTIKSRTQSLRFKRLSMEEIADIFEKKGDEVQRGPMLLSSGSPGKYISLFEGDFIRFLDITEAILETLQAAKNVWTINKGAEEIIKKNFSKKGRAYYGELREYLDFLKNLCDLTLVRGDLELKEFNRFYTTVSAINSAMGRKLSDDPDMRLKISGLVSAAAEEARRASFRFMNFELLMTEFIHTLGLAFRGIS